MRTPTHWARIWPALARRASRQHSLLTRAQCTEAGLSRRQIAGLLARNVIVRIHESVYAVAGARDTHPQRLLAACWAGGERGGTVSHRAAAHLWGLPGGDPDLVEITGPRWRRSRHTGVVAHESKHLDRRQVTVVDGLPVTRPARTLVDLAGEVTGAVLQAAIEEAVRRGLTDVSELWATWEDLGGRIRRGGRRFEAVLDRIATPVRLPESQGEMELLGWVREIGLPEPVPQHRVRLGDGRSARIDLAWPTQRVALEFDSYEWHGGRTAYVRTRRRASQLASLGWEVVTVDGDELRDGAPFAAACLRRYLGVAAA